MPKIYTKTGDGGDTSLLGGKRVSKSCLEIDAIGDIDELNGSIGVLISILQKETTPGRDVALLRLYDIQHRLFTVGSNVAAVQTDLINVPHLEETDVKNLEDWIDAMEKELPALTQFILPGGHPAAACSFLARAICRRAERRVVDLSKKYSLNQLLLQYLNRLSDALFVLGRFLNKTLGKSDITWKK